jgi:protein transport protein SEC31
MVKPGKKNPHEGSYVTSVAWNKEVAHILASASENGLIALWDIKTDSSIFQFRDNSVSSGQRNVVICWSKNISTQIAVTLDDEKKN